jgi:hypothetical protein
MAFALTATFGPSIGPTIGGGFANAESRLPDGLLPRADDPEPWRDPTGHGEADSKVTLVAALKNRGRQATAVLGEAGYGIGRQLANLVTITDPEAIASGGGAVSFGDAPFGPMRLSSRGSFSISKHWPATP